MGYAFSAGPPEEVTRYFGAKSLTPSFAFDDIEPAVHASAFTVAKAMEIDVLEAIRGALERAMAEGTTFREFQRDLAPRLQALGWWGRRDMIDPLTGEAVSARLGSPRRLRTIWRANMRAAPAAGQWDRAQRTKKALPYFVYLLGPSRDHRPEHAAREGMVAAVDDPVWDQWMPPNGWGCKCHVRQITRREAERRGVTPEAEIDALPTAEYRSARGLRTRRVPVGVDPAWAGDPGKTRQASLDAYLAERLETASEDVARAAARDMATSWRAQRIHDGTAAGSVPVALLSVAARRALGARTRVALYSSQTAAKERLKHGDAPLALLARAQEAFDGPDVFRDGNSRVAFVEVGGKLWRIVAKATGDGAEIFITSFHRANAKQLRRWRERGNNSREE